MEKKLSPRRDGAIDLVKALAICAVLCIHCSANHFANYPVGSLRWLATDFFGSVSRWAVPAFLLCSGALMNDPDRDVSIKKLFSRYLLRLAAALGAWAVFYELLRLFFSRGSAPVGQLLLQAGKNLLYGNTYYHLYYFYFVFALYLALPLTRLVVRCASPSELRYIVGLWLLLGGVLRFLQFFWPFSQMYASLLYLVMPAAFLCPGLGLLGWYLRQHPPKDWIAPLLTFLAGFAVTFLGTWRRSAQAGELDQFYLDGFSLFILVMAVGVFRLSQWWGLRWGETPKAVRFLSAASFCVYLVHPFFQALAVPSLFLALPVWLAVPAQAAVLLSLSLAAYWVLRRLPVVGRWLI